jgi:hypothetical protein
MVLMAVELAKTTRLGQWLLHREEMQVTMSTIDSLQHGERVELGAADNLRYSHQVEHPS